MLVLIILEYNIFKKFPVHITLIAATFVKTLK